MPYYNVVLTVQLDTTVWAEDEACAFEEAYDKMQGATTKVGFDDIYLKGSVELDDHEDDPYDEWRDRKHDE